MLQLVSLTQFSHDISTYLLENSVKIISFDPNNITFANLWYFKEIIGGQHIVMIGEQNHGDAPTFHVKT